MARVSVVAEAAGDHDVRESLRHSSADVVADGTAEVHVAADPADWARSAAAAGGEYLLALRSGDLLLPGAVRRALARAEADAEADVVALRRGVTPDSPWGDFGVEPGGPALYRRADVHRWLEADPTVSGPEDLGLVASGHGLRIVTTTGLTDYHRDGALAPGDPDRIRAGLERIVSRASGPVRDAALLATYRDQVLASVGPALLDLEPGRRVSLVASLGAVAARLVPERLDARLQHAHRVRSHLLRHGTADPGGAAGLLADLAHTDRDVEVDAYCARPRWVGAELDVSATAVLVYAGGEPIVSRDDSGRWHRRLSAGLRAAIPSALLDVTDELAAASVRILARGRGTDVSAELPGTAGTSVRPGPGGDAEIAADVRARLAVRAPDVTAMASRGQALWDIGIRFSAMGLEGQAALPVRPAPARVALVDGTTGVAYANVGRALSVDLHSVKRTVVGSALVQPEDVRVFGSGADREVRIALPRVHTEGVTSVAGTLLLSPETPEGGEDRAAARPVPARLVGDSEGARIEARVGGVPDGTYWVHTRFEDRRDGMKLLLRIEPERVVAQDTWVAWQCSGPTPGYLEDPRKK